MNIDINTIKTKVAAYEDVLKNTVNNRFEWQEKVKSFIKETLQNIIDETGLKGKISEIKEIENLESIILDLGRSSSGIAHNRDISDVKNFMIKNNGALTYQQLFNGKIMIMINSPHIEGYSEHNEPTFLEILKPAEINELAILGHVEKMLDTITEWEDFDDDSPQEKTVFQPIGFQYAGSQANDNGSEDKKSVQSNNE